MYFSSISLLQKNLTDVIFHLQIQISTSWYANMLVTPAASPDFPQQSVLISYNDASKSVNSYLIY